MEYIIPYLRLTKIIKYNILIAYYLEQIIILINRYILVMYPRVTIFTQLTYYTIYI